MHHHLDTYAYTNQLCRLHPQQKLIFALVLLLLTLMAQPLTQVLVALWLGVWLMAYARIPPRVYGTLLGAIALFWLTSLPALLVQISPTDVLVRSGEPLVAHLRLGSWSLFMSQGKLVQALDVGLRTIAASSCLLFLLLTTPFPLLLGVLERWSVPPFILDILMLMYRYIFVVWDTALMLQLAQRARGGYQRRSRWFHSVLLLASQLLQQSLQRYETIHLALVSRGFQGQFRVWRGQPYAYSQRYALEALVGLGLLVLLNVTVA